MPAAKSSTSGKNVAAAGAFILIMVVLLVIALMNAPIKTNPLIANDFGLYLAEVAKTGWPFIVAVGVIAAGAGGVGQPDEWPDVIKRAGATTSLRPFFVGANTKEYLTPRSQRTPRAQKEIFFAFFATFAILA